MTVGNTTQYALAIQETFAPGWQEGVFRNDQLLSLFRQFGMIEMPMRGNNYKWHINTAVNSSVGIYTEGQAAPSSGAQTWAEPAIEPVYYWAWMQLSGHLRDSLADGAIFDAISAEFELSQRDIVDLRTTTMLGSSNNGLLQAISASSTYAGITRGSAAYFESSIDSSNASLSLSKLRTLATSQKTPDKRGKRMLNLCTIAGEAAYAALAGTPAAQYNSWNVNVNGQVGTDWGYLASAMKFDGAPVVAMPDMTASTWMGIDFSAGNIKHLIARPFMVDFHHNSGDDQVFKITTASTLVVEQPRWQAAHTSMT